MNCSNLLLFVLSTLISLGCVQRRDTSHQLKDEVRPTEEESTSSVYFNFPACLPNCLPEHADALRQNSYMEKAVVDAVSSAAKTVDFSMFTFSREDIFQALIAAAEKGARVRGIVDKGQFTRLKECTPAGCQFTGPLAANEYLQLAPSARYQYLQDKKLLPAEASVAEKLAMIFYKLPNGSAVKPAPGERLVHNKLVLVDGSQLVTGSGNWSSTGMGINLENLDIVRASGDAEVIKAFQCMLDVVWTGDANMIAKDLPGCETPSVFFTPAPWNKGISQVIVKAVNDAKQTISISMHHLTHPDVSKALEAAASRGVKVRMMVDDDDCNIKMPPNIASLVAKGVEIRYFPTNCDMFQLSHNKFGIFDGSKVLNGSANWSKSGLSRNYENFIIYQGAADVAAFQSFYDKAWALTQDRSQCTCDTTKQECRAKYCLDRKFD